MASLARMRRDRGLTQKDVGQKLGCHASHICRFERGQSLPTLSGFRRMRDLYGVTSDALFAAFDAAMKGWIRRRREADNGRERVSA